MGEGGSRQGGQVDETLQYIAGCVVVELGLVTFQQEMQKAEIKQCLLVFFLQ